MLLLGGAAINMLAIATPAMAQIAADVPSRGNDEIIVTAQRREQTLQKVPLAISAFGTQDLANRQVEQTLDLVHYVPNMVGHNNTSLGSANVYYIRGLGNTESIATFDPPVGTYVDDVYIARQNLNNFGFFDVERVEVLRGPQGTLFGRNTTGGAINIILKKPKDAVSGYVEGEYGRFNKVGGRASIDLPISPTILTKFSAFGSRDDGYVKQLKTGKNLNYAHTYGLRGAVRLLPSDDVTWDISSDYVSDNSANILNVLDPITGKRVANTGYVQGSLVPFFTGKKADYPLSADTRSWAVTSNLSVDIGGANLTSITGYRNTEQGFVIDSGGEPPNITSVTGTSPLANFATYKQFTQELKLSGKTLNDRLEYVLGLYYMKERNKTDFANGSYRATGFVVLADRTLYNNTSAPAVYGQFDFHATDKLTLTAGGRFTDEKKTVAVVRNPGALGSTIDTAAIVAAGIPTKLRKKIFTPRFAAQYQASDDVMIFASATRGFKSGGWNARATDPTLFLPFKPEVIWSEELGMRTDLFNKTLRLNATAFYSVDRDVQVASGYFVGSVPTYNTINPADLRVYGAEFEVTWRPTTRFTFNGSLGLTQPAYKNIAGSVRTQQTACVAGIASNNATAISNNCARGFIDQFGQIATPARTPKKTASALATYTFDIGRVSLTPVAGISIEGAHAISSSGSPQSTNGSFVGTQWLLNLGVTLRPLADPNISLSVSCKNCLGKDYPASFIAPFVYLDAPGTWLVSASYKF